MRVRQQTPGSKPIWTSNRIVALVFAPWYLLGITLLLSDAMEISPQLGLLLVLLGSAIIIGSLTVLSVKYLSVAGGMRQFRISTMLLLMLPLSVYLVAIRAVMQRLPTAEFNAFAWILVSIFAIAFVVLSTAVLLCLAEALWWLALGALRQWRRRTGR